MRSFEVASRSRQSETEWRVIIVELALIEHAHLGRTFRASFVHRTVATCHGQLKQFLRNRITSTCMFFLSMYTFIILTMRLCAQRNSCPKRTEWSEDLIHTNIHPPELPNKVEGNHMTFLNVYIDRSSSIVSSVIDCRNRDNKYRLGVTFDKHNLLRWSNHDDLTKKNA